MFSWYKYLIVSLLFSHLGFWSGNLFLIAPFPDLCLFVPSYIDFHCLKQASQYSEISASLRDVFQFLNKYFSLFNVYTLFEVILAVCFVVNPISD